MSLNNSDMITFSALNAATSVTWNATNVDELLKAVNAAQPGDIIEVAEGNFALPQQLTIKSGLTLRGTGKDKTILTALDSFAANPATLPDPETNHKAFDRTGYLLQIEEGAKNVTIANLKMMGPKLHGAVFGFDNQELLFRDLHIEDFMYCGIRTYSMKQVVIHDCVFVNSGMRWEKGQLGRKGGITGGAIFGIWMADTEIYDCRFENTRTQPHEHFYGIKGRQAKRCRFHHNTINTGFSIELPFEGDEDVEIDHNYLLSTISIPKYAGGRVPASGRTFHIHHNYFRDTYSIEFVRNGVEIDHNLFDFDTAEDHGNLISAFGEAAAPGPASFHNNLVSNPGRGVMWMNEPYANLIVRNNHIIARTTKTPRTDGLFGFHEKSDFTTFQFINNIIQCVGTPRPFFRNDASGKSVVENNRLINVTDTHRYQNHQSKEQVGLEEPLHFECGVRGEMTVRDWELVPTSQIPVSTPLD